MKNGYFYIVSKEKHPRYISPEHWMEELKPQHKKWVTLLLSEWLKTDAKLRLKISYNTLFIYRLGPVCYFNLEKDLLYIGFYWGKALENINGIIETDERKMVGIVPINSSVLSTRMDDLMAIFLLATDFDNQKYKK